jgi:NTE family protein
MVNRAVQEFRTNVKGQVVLVLQGGGALGAYQVGVYQALHEAGVEPDWIIGTSIGAINAALIAGNEPKDRLNKLNEFWSRVQRKDPWSAFPAWTGIPDQLSFLSTIANGIPNFFLPNLPAFLGARTHLGVDRAGYYSTAPLRETLNDLVDFSLVNRCSPRLTVGAAHVKSSMMKYFDSRETPLAVEHIMASGALPPAFPAVRIDGELYWDGGILSNTPAEVIFDDNPRKNSLIFAVHMWNPNGEEPSNLWEVAHRQKDIQYSSRITTHITRQQQIHRMRHIISQLAQHLPEDVRNSPAARELISYGCTTRMHVVRLLAPRLDAESHIKDVDFSLSGIKMRREAGYQATMRALMQAPWQGEFAPLDGVVLYEPKMDLAMAAE